MSLTWSYRAMQRLGVDASRCKHCIAAAAESRHMIPLAQRSCGTGSRSWWEASCFGVHAGRAWTRLDASLLPWMPELVRCGEAFIKVA